MPDSLYLQLSVIHAINIKRIFLSVCVFPSLSWYVSGNTCWRPLVLSLMAGVCAMLSKEQGITIFGVCLAYDVFVINQVCIHKSLIQVKLFNAYNYDFLPFVLPNFFFTFSKV